MPLSSCQQTVRGPAPGGGPHSGKHGARGLARGHRAEERQGQGLDSEMGVSTTPSTGGRGRESWCLSIVQDHFWEVGVTGKSHRHIKGFRTEAGANIQLPLRERGDRTRAVRASAGVTDTPSRFLGRPVNSENSSKLLLSAGYLVSGVGG